MPVVIIHREQLPDGTIKLWERQENGQVTQTVIGTPRNLSGEALTSIAPYKELYADPWYQEFVLGPQNQAQAEMRSAREFGQGLQGRQVALSERTADANIQNQRDALEQRKREYRMSYGLQERGLGLQQRGQDMQANLALAGMRGPGNAAQFVDASRRLRGFGTESGALAQIAAGGVPTGGGGMSYGMAPVSLRDRMSGMMGATGDQIDRRDRNDRALASRIASAPGHLMRGSIEQLTPFERQYLGSYMEDAGYDDASFEDAYRRAGIHQGRRVGA